MIRKNSKFLILILSLLAAKTHAQEFKMSALLDSVPATGFYQVDISADLTAYAKADFSDIRIAEKGGMYTPYIIRSRNAVIQDTGLVREMKIISNVTDSVSTTILLESGGGNITSGISLTMNNTMVERYAQVSGSDDNANWYIIDDHLLLQRTNGTTNGKYAQYINFPGSKYHYFKLKIDNAHTDPLHVIGASAIRMPVSIEYKTAERFIENLKVIQKDSADHYSYVLVRNSKPYLVNQFSITITGAKLYERNMTVYILSSDTDSSSLNISVADFVLSSSHSATFKLPGLKAQAILLRIDNKDNPPLKITEAEIFQEGQYLVSWLEKGKKYNICVGNEGAIAPQYDLSKFIDSIPASIPALSYGAFSALPPVASKVMPKKEIPGYWLWIGIILSVTVLSGLTYRLMKDIKKDTV